MTPMPQSTDKPKAENVTISTVRTPEEAQRITNSLKAANIESCLADERAAVGAGKTKSHFGGVKIQVPRSEAKRAIQLLQDLQEKSVAEILPDGDCVAPENGLRAWFRVDSWTRAAMEVAAILLLAGALLALYF
jgi:hypothetical protein